MSTTEPSNESEASHPGRLRAITAYQFHCRPILARSKTAAVAEEQSFEAITLNDRNGSIADLAPMAAVRPLGRDLGAP